MLGLILQNLGRLIFPDCNRAGGNILVCYSSGTINIAYISIIFNMYHKISYYSNLLRITGTKSMIVLKNVLIKLKT